MMEIEELKIIADMTVKLTELRQKECTHLSVDDFAAGCFGHLLAVKMEGYKYYLPQYIAGFSTSDEFDVDVKSSGGCIMDIMMTPKKSFYKLGDHIPARFESLFIYTYGIAHWCTVFPGPDGKEIAVLHFKSDDHKVECEKILFPAERIKSLKPGDYLVLSGNMIADE